jgi:hypothetical protein
MGVLFNENAQRGFQASQEKYLHYPHWVASVSIRWRIEMIPLVGVRREVYLVLVHMPELM